MKSAVVSLGSTSLSASERRMLRDYSPIGVILFSRNIDSFTQVSDLVADCRDAVSHPYVHVFVDQEGKTTASRLTPLIPCRLRDAVFFRELIERNIEIVWHLLILQNKIIAYYMRLMGINVNCAPVADILQSDTNKFLRHRIFGDNPSTVTSAARCVASTLFENGIIPVIKHFPGHGKVVEDSHYNRAICNESPSVLLDRDLLPFKDLHKDFDWFMSSHVIYSAVSDEPITVSLEAMNFFKAAIDFRGIMISDAIEMNALDGDLGYRSKRAINAGIDVVLACTGKVNDNIAVLDNVPDVDEELFLKIKRSFQKSRYEKGVIDIESLEKEFETSLEGLSDVLS